MKSRLVFILVAWVAPAPIALRAQTLSSAHTEYIRVGNRVVATVATPAVYFTDAAFGNSAYAPFLNAADFMYTYHITSGCTTTTFCPDLPLASNALAVFVVRAWSLRMWGDAEAFWQQNRSPVNTAAHFSDVPTGDPYYRYVQKLYELGITSGCTATQFCPSNNATNFETSVYAVLGRSAADQKCIGPADYSGRSCAQTLASYTYSDSPSFSDVPKYNSDGSLNSIYPWAQYAIAFWATSPYIAITGCPNGAGYFCPTVAATRGQMAAYILRVIFGETDF